VPRILMHVQVILRIELLVHHKESSWIGNNTTCSPSCSCWMENSKHYQRIKLEPHGDTITTTTITKVESTLDKLKEARVIHDETGRYNHVYEYPLTALLTTFSIVLTMLTGGIWCLRDDCLPLWPCLISLLCNDCWCIVGLLPTMTSIA